MFSGQPYGKSQSTAMSRFRGLEITYQPDWPGLIDNLGRQGTPKRVYNIEFLMDPEVQDAICRINKTYGTVAAGINNAAKHPDNHD